MDRKFFPEVPNNFGFGCMRLPMNGEEVDTEQFSKMIEMFFDAGLTYFILHTDTFRARAKQPSVSVLQANTLAANTR